MPTSLEGGRVIVNIDGVDIASAEMDLHRLDLPSDIIAGLMDGSIQVPDECVTYTPGTDVFAGGFNIQVEIPHGGLIYMKDEPATIEVKKIPKNTKRIILL